MGVTLKQIADMAGVHKSTVDKVLHNRPGVSEEKRAEIRRLLEENHYESNPLAKALNYQKKKMKIAVILPKVEAVAELKRGMDVVEQDFNNFNISVDYHFIRYSASEEARCIRALLEENVAGIILIPIESKEVENELRKLNEKKIPLVLINSDVQNVSRLCYVGEDARKSGHTMARMMQLWMRDAGSIGIISTEHMKTARERERYFRDYLATREMNLHYIGTTSVEETDEEVYGAAKKMLQYSDLRAIYITCGLVGSVCRAIEEAGRSQEVLVFCYERYPANVELIKSGKIACCLDPDLFDQGRMGMRFLFEYLVYERKPERERYYTRNEILLQENI